MLILDLDNTIFETKTISSKIFKPVLDLIKEYYQSINENTIANQLIEELWSTPMDKVFEKYHTPNKLIDQAYSRFNNLDFHLEIDTYDDYNILKEIQKEKILVTTGYEKLQLAKIKALQINSDFKEIIIDNPISKNRKYKHGIFKDILKKENMKPEEVWVIGDSVENEIKAGKELGMNTIQRLKNGNKKSIFSDHGIASFHELNKIIK